MANGEPWYKYYGQNNTIACPSQFPFGTRILLDGVEYTCRDRGGAIVTNAKGEHWLDILGPSVPYYYGEVRTAYILD